MHFIIPPRSLDFCIGGLPLGCPIPVIRHWHRLPIPPFHAVNDLLAAFLFHQKQVHSRDSDTHVFETPNDTNTHPHHRAKLVFLNGYCFSYLYRDRECKGIETEKEKAERLKKDRAEKNGGEGGKKWSTASSFYGTILDVLTGPCIRLVVSTRLFI